MTANGLLPAADGDSPQGSPEQTLILQAVRHLILGESQPLEAPGQVDRATLARLVAHTNSGPLMHHVLSPLGVAPELRAQWQRLRLQSLRENVRALRTVSKLLAALESAHVPAATLRGLPLAHSLYPDPGLRPMHDVDILIRPEDAARCEAALQTLGYKPVERLRSQHVYHIDGTVIEVHRSVLTAKRYRAALRAADLLAARQPQQLPDGTVLQVLCPAHELICLVCHALVHHEMERLLFVADIGLLQARAPIDWPLVQEFCRQARLTRMVGLALGFVNWVLDLGRADLRERFDVPEAKVRTFSAAYQAHLFGQAGLRHYLMRKRAAFYVAETPARRLRQALRQLSWREIRPLWAHVAGHPQPHGREE